MNKYLLSLFFVLLGVGCSSSEPGPGAQDSKLKNEGLFCGEWAKVACNEDVVNACSGTTQGCRSTQKSVCQVLVPPGYSSANAQDCLDAVEDAYADAELTAEELDVVTKLGGACKGLVDGGATEGEACTVAANCDTVNGFDCVIKSGDPTGTCQVPSEVGGGRRCDTPDSVCEADFYCNGTNCVEGLGMNDACSASEPCISSLRCNLSSTNPTCLPRLADRQPCVADEECESRICIGRTETDKICVSSEPLTVLDPLCDTLG